MADSACLSGVSAAPLHYLNRTSTSLLQMHQAVQASHRKLLVFTVFTSKCAKKYQHSKAICLHSQSKR